MHVDNGLQIPAWNGRRAARALDEIKRKGGPTARPAASVSSPSTTTCPQLIPTAVVSSTSSHAHCSLT